METKPPRTTECPSCQGAGRHDAIDGQRSATCGTCEGVRTVDLSEIAEHGIGLAFAVRYAHEWHLAYDYLEAEPVARHLRHEPAIAMAVVVHALVAQLDDRIRPCSTCEEVCLDGDCAACVAMVAAAEATQRRQDAYERRDDGMVAA